MSSSRLGDTIGAGRIHFPASSDSNMMYEPFHHFTRSAKSSFEYDGGVPLLAGKVSIKILAKMAIEVLRLNSKNSAVPLCCTAARFHTAAVLSKTRVQRYKN